MHARRRWIAALVAVIPVVGHAQSTGSTVPAIPGLPSVSCVPAGGANVSAALAGPIAFVIARAGETTACLDVSSFFRAGTKTSSLSATGLLIGGLGSVDLTSTVNPDPFVNFGATTTNLVAGPVTYAFLFGTPIVPGLYTTATSTGGVSVTNGPAVGNTSTATVAPSGIYPTFIGGFGTNGAAATDLGVGIGSTACTATGAPSTVTQTCNYGSMSTSFAPTFYDNLEALLTYDQTGLTSVASWSGAVTLGTGAPTTAPEPATLALVGGGLLMLGVAARRRARG